MSGFAKRFKTRFLAYMFTRVGNRITAATGRVYTDKGNGWRREIPGFSGTCREWKRERMRRKLDNRRARRAAKRTRLEGIRG